MRRHLVGSCTSIIHDGRAQAEYAPNSRLDPAAEKQVHLWEKSLGETVATSVSLRASFVRLSPGLLPECGV